LSEAAVKNQQPVAEKAEQSAEAAALRARVAAMNMVNAGPRPPSTRARRSMSYGERCTSATRGHDRNRNYDCGRNSRSIKTRITSAIFLARAAHPVFKRMCRSIGSARYAR
jgi:hypothetical protein